MKLNSKFWKGLAITLMGVIVAAFDQQPVLWSVVIILLIGNAIVYFGKNAWYQSSSKKHNFNWKDIASALLIAVGSAVVSGVASIAGTGIIDWSLLWKVASGAVIAYISGTLLEGKK